MDATSPAKNPTEVEHRPAPAGAPPRRRPSGEPPPLPHQLGRTGKFWLVMVGYFLATAIGVLTFPTFAQVLRDDGIRSGCAGSPRCGHRGSRT